MTDDTAATGGASAVGTPPAPAKKWRMRTMSKDEVLGFVNGAPAQQAGEMVVANRSDGKVDLYYYSTTD